MRFYFALVCGARFRYGGKLQGAFSLFFTERLVKTNYHIINKEMQHPILQVQYITLTREVTHSLQDLC